MFNSKNEVMANILGKGVLLSKAEEENQKQEEGWETLSIMHMMAVV